MTVVTLSAKGQLVIPSEIRGRYGLRQGDRLIIEEREGEIVLRPTDRYPILALRGSLKGGPDLTAMLLKERREDLEREDRKRG